MTRTTLLFALLAAAGVSASASAVELVLQWRPTSDVNDQPSIFSPERWTHDHSKDTPPADELEGTRFQVLPFVDKRKQPEIGANVEQSLTRELTTRDDVAAFVGSHIGEVLQEAHVNVVDQGGNRLLKGEVLKFFVHEDNTYAGEVLLRLTLENGQGKALWEGTAVGHSKRFGHSMSPENYNETFSDAVVDAVTDLLKNHGFMKAARER